jgi:DNA-binding response OmpR family regulator
MFQLEPGRNPASTAPRWNARVNILVVDADPPLHGLLEEWLTAQGWSVLREGDPVDLIVVDLAHPVRGGPDVLKRLAREHAGTPVLALSSSFFPSVASDGAVARTLGVAGVLPKPLTRDALLAAVRRTLPA